MAARRIQKELNEITREPPMNCFAGLKNESNPFEWEATITGPEGSPYAGGVFFINIKFPQDYPYMPPAVNFETKIYHPNFDSSGKVCIDILKNNWSRDVSISKVLESVSSMLTAANLDKPLVSEIAHQYETNFDEYKRTAQLWTQRYAM